MTRAAVYQTINIILGLFFAVMFFLGIHVGKEAFYIWLSAVFFATTCSMLALDISRRGWLGRHH